MFTLTREETATADAIANRHQWPVRFVAAYSSNAAAAKIFVMHQSPDAALFADSLSCVASAVQMTDLPADEPAAGSPFYRVATVTKLCRSAKAAEEFAEKVKEAVQDLADNLAAAAELSVAETITITSTIS
jgi:hypothetical protein